MKFIYQEPGWPNLSWRAEEVACALSALAYEQGRFTGMLSRLGFDMQKETGFAATCTEIAASSEIEGEKLNAAEVRSSVARRMDIKCEGCGAVRDRAIEAKVEMLLDATENSGKPVTGARLKAWHAALFPSGYSGLVKIRAGKYRDDSDGPMRVASRRGMLERVHFQAPGAEALGEEMKSFLAWLNAEDAGTPPQIRVALAHLRFLTIHPFDDGNGRIARALTEWMLARMERTPQRLYSLSREILKEKDDYYLELEHAQRNSLDVTRWVRWFLGCHLRAITGAQEMLSGILAKADFWLMHQGAVFNERQRKMLNRLLDGFKGNLTTGKWAKICKVSQDTAGRDIEGLLACGVLTKEGSGRSTHYRVSRAEKGNA